VFIIMKFLTAHDAMELFSSPMHLCVQIIGDITWTNGGKRTISMVEQFNDIIMWHGGQESHTLNSIIR
jgi:hypothetical protein